MKIKLIPWILGIRANYEKYVNGTWRDIIAMCCIFGLQGSSVEKYKGLWNVSLLEPHKLARSFS